MRGDQAGRGVSLDGRRSPAENQAESVFGLPGRVGAGL